MLAWLRLRDTFVGVPDDDLVRYLTSGEAQHGQGCASITHLREDDATQDRCLVTVSHRGHLDGAYCPLGSSV